MPAVIVGAVKVTNVGGNGTINVGDVLQIAPKSTNKSNLGGGGGNTGDFMMTNTVLSVTNSFDPDIIDSNNKANN
ncbi:spore germination protein GerPA/GerPF [Anoxybacillus vitaminiphilus]|uniref:Spore germination protein GerPA/GerPF n=1 Tax=Paranoxybacillus vitaminiphilus TaxID=581036 RepID=A0A327YGC6_9BACL|nr:spore germination protein [Anoxybacillus vitaminiphilus]RAK19527.1 spore germination protein GerPA/GerPF [Anoxybacillus vitaminiphilus]